MEDLPPLHHRHIYTLPLARLATVAVRCRHETHRLQRAGGHGHSPAHSNTARLPALFHLCYRLPSSFHGGRTYHLLPV